MSPDESLRRAAPDVSRETLERLEIYAALVRKWSPRINLVSRGSLDHLWDRHFVDSAQINGLAGAVGHWADLGSGGGFPGLVVAILRAGEGAGTKVTLVESDQRKAAFLRTVARETGVEVTVLSQRIEDIAPLHADVLSARALAPLEKLLVFAETHLSAGGTALFPKGASHRDEIAKALETFSFDCEEYPSLTDPEAVILKIGAIQRV